LGWRQVVRRYFHHYCDFDITLFDDNTFCFERLLCLMSPRVSERDVSSVYRSATATTNCREIMSMMRKEGIKLVDCACEVVQERQQHKTGRSEGEGDRGGRCVEVVGVESSQSSKIE
jgi:hypothetical protein